MNKEKTFQNNCKKRDRPFANQEAICAGKFKAYAPPTHQRSNQMKMQWALKSLIRIRRHGRPPISIAIPHLESGFLAKQRAVPNSQPFNREAIQTKSKLSGQRCPMGFAFRQFNCPLNKLPLKRLRRPPREWNVRTRPHHPLSTFQ